MGLILRYGLSRVLYNSPLPQYESLEGRERERGREHVRARERTGKELKLDLDLWEVICCCFLIIEEKD